MPSRLTCVVDPWSSSIQGCQSRYRMELSLLVRGGQEGRLPAVSASVLLWLPRTLCILSEHEPQTAAGPDNEVGMRSREGGLDEEVEGKDEGETLFIFKTGGHRLYVHALGSRMHLMQARIKKQMNRAQECGRVRCVKETIVRVTSRNSTQDDERLQRARARRTMGSCGKIQAPAPSKIKIVL